MLLVLEIYWDHCFQKFQKLENITEKNCKLAQKIESGWNLNLSLNNLQANS